MPQIRQEPITDTWVIIAAERNKRPSDFGKVGNDKEDKNGAKNCPFCVGNENMTPPEVFAFRDEGTKPNTPGWSIRVTPNKFAALNIEGEVNKSKMGLYKIMNGVGAHEVIAESSDHDTPFDKQSDEHVKNILKAWRFRYQDLGLDPRIKYTQLFKNFGSAAGASLSHPHSQLIATPLVPKYIADEMQRIKEYYAEHGKCLMCEITAFECEDKSRMIFEDENFAAFCPYAARFPFEIWIAPKKHSPQFANISDNELQNLAMTLKKCVAQLADTLDKPPYNLVVHTAPYREKDEENYHWHIEILPRLTKVAGFEWGTGYFINPTPPETAAEYLKIKH